MKIESEIERDIGSTAVSLRRATLANKVSGG
jgi:hypothetical protein